MSQPSHGWLRKVGVLDFSWMMEGQTPYSMFKKGLKLIPKEVRTKVA